MDGQEAFLWRDFYPNLRPFWTPFSCLDNCYTSMPLSDRSRSQSPPPSAEASIAVSKGSNGRQQMRPRKRPGPRLCFAPSLAATESVHILRFEEKGNPMGKATRDWMSFVKYKRLHTDTQRSVEPSAGRVMFGGVAAPQKCSRSIHRPRTQIPPMPIPNPLPNPQKNSFRLSWLLRTALKEEGGVPFGSSRRI